MLHLAGQQESFCFSCFCFRKQNINNTLILFRLTTQPISHTKYSGNLQESALICLNLQKTHRDERIVLGWTFILTLEMTNFILKLFSYITFICRS